MKTITIDNEKEVLYLGDKEVKYYPASWAATEWIDLLEDIVTYMFSRQTSHYLKILLTGARFMSRLR